MKPQNKKISDDSRDSIIEENRILKEKLEKLEKQLEKKEDESNWLYEKTLKRVNFNERLTKNEAIYIGSNKFEQDNNIYKIGKSNVIKNRQNSLKTGTSPINEFKMHKIYEVLSGLELATEKYIHALMDPLHVNDVSTTEHFMCHIELIDLIIDITIKSQFKSINLINKYIQILKKHNFDFEITKPIIYEFLKKHSPPNEKDNSFEYAIGPITKQCNKCYNEYLLDKFIDDLCIQCNNLLEKENLIDTKKCERCNKIHNKTLFFKDIENNNEDGLLNICNICYNAEKGILHKCCIVCSKIKPLDDFGANHNNLDKKSTRCKDCARIIRNGNAETLPKIPCNICGELLSPSSNILYHQKGKACKAAAAAKGIIQDIPSTNNPMECYKCRKTHNKKLYFKKDNEFIKTCKTCYDEDIGELYKHCNRCDTIKPYDVFSSDRTQGDGKKATCRACLNPPKEQNLRSARVECDTCGKVLSIKNMSRHKKSESCKAAGLLRLTQEKLQEQLQEQVSN